VGDTELELTKDMIMIERGKEELLLANSSSLQPLYIRSGRGHIKKLLESVPGLCTAEKIQESFPGDVQLVQMLLDHRILVDKGREKIGYYKSDLSWLKASRKDRSGMSLYLLLTQSCNLGCLYCLNGGKTYKSEKLLMTEEVAYRSVERGLDSLNSDGKLEIAFFGGEPLLNWPLAKKVIRFCEDTLKQRHKEKQAQYHITSNLTFLPDDLIEWAKRYHINFLCDIDGPEEIHDRCRPYKEGGSSYGDITANV
jgi:uncharacterized protein